MEVIEIEEHMEINVEDAKKLFLDAKSADVNFIIYIELEPVEKVPAHKKILAAISEVFNKMFFGVLKEEGDIKIYDSTVEAFKTFLWYCYSGDVALTKQNIDMVMYLSHKYDVSECLMKGAQFIEKRLPFEHVLWGYELAVEFHCDGLRTKLERQICEDPAIVFASDEFRECGPHLMKRILELDTNWNPMYVFESCIKWAVKKCQDNGLDPTIMKNLRNELGVCFHYIPFPLMAAAQIADCVSQYKDLFDRDELAELLMITVPNKVLNLKLFKKKASFMSFERVTQSTCHQIHHEFQFDSMVKQRELFRFNVTENCRLVGIEMFPVRAIGITETLIASLQVVDMARIPNIELLNKRFAIECPKNDLKIEFNKPIACTPQQTIKILIDFGHNWMEHIFYTVRDHSIKLFTMD